jgi:cardiolipin synthase
MNEAPATGQQTTAIESIADLSKLVGAPARPATEIRILRDGENTFPAMIELIDAAQSEVLFENFIFAGDETGRRFADVMCSGSPRCFGPHAPTRPQQSPARRSCSQARI